MSTTYRKQSLISILSWGGIGDTLRNISLVPHELLFRRFGIRSRVFYMHWSKTNFRVETGPPDPEWFRDLVTRCPSLCWGGQVDSYGGFGRLSNLGMRLAIKSVTGRPQFFPFDVALTAVEREGLPRRPSGLVIAVQTHLSGMKTKRWGFENWRGYLRSLLSDTDASIVLFDTEERVSELCFDDRIQTTRGLTLPQSIAVLRSCDFLVSIDSWTKYVAAWSSIPQLLIVPDQQSEYVLLSAPNLIKNELAGLWGNPTVEVLGVRGGNEPQFTFGALANLSVDEVVARTRAGIDTVQTPPART